MVYFMDMKYPRDLTTIKFGTLTPIEIISTNKSGHKIWRCSCDCGKEKIASRSDLTCGNVKSCGVCQRSTIAKDLLGQKFGRLTVINKSTNLSSNKTAWLCQCECGKIKAIKTSNLLQGKAKSCGCQINYNKINLIGRKFGRLQVAAKVHVKNSHRFYLCICDCGQETIVDGTQLTKGFTRSCGCLSRELLSILAKAQIGDKNPAWKGGITEEFNPRHTKEYLDWRKAIVDRDVLCQICGVSENLEAHHLLSFIDNVEKRTDLTNGICLCRSCHIAFHIEYGKGHNTPQQFELFKKSLGLV